MLKYFNQFHNFFYAETHLTFWWNMNLIPNKNNYLKPIVILLIFTLLTNCTPWKVLKEPVKDQIIQKEPAEVKLKLKTGESFELKKPIVHEDSLTGIKWKNDTLTFSFSEIKEARVRELHRTITIIIVTVIIIVPAILIGYAPPQAN